MKVTVSVHFSGSSVKFEVSVGAGDKTFKWLGNTASQRFATQDPNGSLRRRDPVRRGMSKFSSHQGVEVSLPSGQVPHPSALLMDFLRDGDEVNVYLNDHQEINSKSGSALQNEWSTLAYSVNGSGIGETKKREGGYQEEEDKEVVEGEHYYTKEQKAGRARFMKLILRSQMPDLEVIQKKVSEEWKVIGKHLKGMDEDTHDAVIQVFVDNWDLVNEVHTFLATNHNGSDVLLSEDWRKFLEETNIFGEADIDYYGPRIHKTAHVGTAKDKDSMPALSVAGFIYAIILCAQSCFNDRHDEALNKLSPAASLRKLFQDNFSPMSERYEMKCMLKEHFCTLENLNALKEWRDSIFDCFTKYAGRSKELPTSIGYKDFTEMLFDAGLTEASETDTKGNPISFELETAAALLASVRSGTIIGRAEPNANPTAATDLPDDEIPSDEFTFPEMVEAICRHSFTRFRGSKPDEDGTIIYLDYGGELTIEDCFFKGMVGVLATLNK